MPEKVTLWRASNGMHYTTQAQAELAEVEAELDAYLTSQVGGGDPELRGRIIRLCLGMWDGPPRSRDETRSAEGPAEFAARMSRRERGAAVIARYAAALVKHAEALPGEPGSLAEAQQASKRPEPVQVAEPVRRRAIRSGPREPATPEGDSMGQGLNFDTLPRPGRKSAD